MDKNSPTLSPDHGEISQLEEGFDEFFPFFISVNEDTEIWAGICADLLNNFDPILENTGRANRFMLRARIASLKTPNKKIRKYYSDLI